MSSVSSPSPIIVGYTCKLREDALDMLAEPVAPKTYKKPESIAEWQAEQRLLLSSEGSGLKITGQIARFVAVDLRGGSIIDSETAKRLYSDEPEGVTFARWLLETREYQLHFPDKPRGGDYGVAFYGFNLKPFFRVLGVECSTAGFPIPMGLWYANDMIYDPYDMLVENDHNGLWRKMFPLAKVLLRGGLSLKRDYVMGTNPMIDTKVAMEMMFRFGLVGNADLDALGEVLRSKAFTDASETRKETAPKQKRSTKKKKGTG